MAEEKKVIRDSDTPVGAGPPSAKSRFEEGRRPSEQGDGSESAESIKERERGIGAESGSRSAHGERGATEATED